jgi:N-acetyl-gamma-glutamylphosphate reductase
VDASTAHRTDPAWVYGFAELCQGQAKRIAEASRVANPGCYATGAIALGGFLLAKFPIKFLSKRAENIYSSNRKIQVRENPDSVKRIKA